MKPAPAPAGVLFDLDGTLADTADDLGAAANHVRHTLGLEPLPLAAYRPAASAGARGLLGVALGLTPEHADFARHRSAFLDYYREHLCVHTVLFDGVAELLEMLEQRGCAWGVVTNKPRALTQPLMQALRLDTRAACCVSGDDAARPKPAPDTVLLACSQAGLAPARCWYVGDDLRDIQAGRAAGLYTVAADWGYLGEGGPIHTWGADGIAADVPTLGRWLADL